MKKKLNILFVLISLSLSGIIIFQIYWTVDAYNVNKEKFDNNIDMAMQKAMDDCKKDYFDSIRVVLVRRLSDTAIKIRIDTLHETDTIHKQLSIYVKSKYSGITGPFHITSNQLNYYGSLIKHKPTLPEILTEASFYIPALMNNWELLLGMDDIENHKGEMYAYLKTHNNVPADSIIAHNILTLYGIYALPKNYRKADSIKLHNHLKQELNKIHINTISILISQHVILHRKNSIKTIAKLMSTVINIMVLYLYICAAMSFLRVQYFVMFNIAC